MEPNCAPAISFALTAFRAIPCSVVLYVWSVGALLGAEDGGPPAWSSMPTEHLVSGPCSIFRNGG